MTKEFNVYQYPNGITLLHKQVVSTRIAHCGYIFDVGSRDEDIRTQGLAHFWEHMAFKGTEKRKTFQILSSLEDVGGDLNAYTTKEKIWFHASLPCNYLERATDVLTDISFYSVFPEKEIEKEKKVVLEEMHMYADNPEDAIQDEFESIIFPNHSLGFNILGTEKTLESFKQQNLKSFLKKNIDTGRVAFVVLSPHSFGEVKKIADKYIPSVKAQHSTKVREKNKGFKPATLIKKIDASQTHCVIGGIGLNIKEERRLGLFLLSNLLAGPGMTSSLNMAMREKKGYVYTIESNFTSYIDTGVYSFYFATESKQFEKALDVFHKEINKVRDKKLSAVQLHRLKEQIKGQLIMAEENNSNFMQMMGKSYLDFGKIDSFDQIVKKIDGISAQVINDLANQLMNPARMSKLIYEPESK
ncbi:MAG: M16 family metallopeptidase [Cytophaga sp.]|uniref:M16 family metallopeptidase n=1 Tax=Cytophaga sp. TaxID=29535 RepID=UPI003F801EAB